MTSVSAKVSIEIWRALGTRIPYSAYCYIHNVIVVFDDEIDMQAWTRDDRDHVVCDVKDGKCKFFLNGYFTESR